MKLGRGGIQTKWQLLSSLDIVSEWDADSLSVSMF